MTVNEKLTSLLSAANTKTGAGDSDLTGAVGTLIDGYGQGTHSPTISVAANGIITASCGGSSTTHTLSSSDDADFIAGNIKDGVTLFGLLGTLSGGGGGGIKVYSKTFTYANNQNWISVSYPDGLDKTKIIGIGIYCPELYTTPAVKSVIGLIFVKQTLFFTSPYFTKDFAYAQLATGASSTAISTTGGLNCAFPTLNAGGLDVVHNNRDFTGGKTYQLSFIEGEVSQ